MRISMKGRGKWGKMKGEWIKDAKKCIYFKHRNEKVKKSNAERNILEFLSYKGSCSVIFTIKVRIFLLYKKLMNQDFKCCCFFINVYV